jgi:SSS family solute:Na+ symporter
MAPVDLVIVVLYVAGTTLFGAWFARRQGSIRTYFVGDRDVSWWLILISIVATETSTVTFLSVPGLAFNRQEGNLTFLQLSFGYVVGRILIAALLLPQYLSGELLSAYQLLQKRFNAAVQRTASAVFLLTRAVADGLRLYLAALLLQEVTGWDGATSILVIGAATMLYTYLGGMQAVIWTDVIQFAVYVSGAALAAALILHQVGGWEPFVAAGERADKFRLLDFSTDRTRPFTFWAGLIGGAFFTMASHGADQMMVQRYLCSRSLREARVALVASGFVVLVQFAFFLLIGVGLYVLFTQRPGELPGDIRDDRVFGYFIVRYLPPGVVGLLIAAVLAASMGSLSSSLNSSAGAFVGDFYRPLRPGRTDAHYLAVSRVMTLFWGLTRVGVALLAVRLLTGTGIENSVVTQVLRVAAITTGMLLGLFLLGSLRRPVRSGAALAGVVVGLAVVLVLWLPSAVGPRLRDWVGGSGAPGWLATWAAEPIAWPWYAPAGTLVTVAVALLLDRLGSSHGPPANGEPQPGLDEPR